MAEYPERQRFCLAVGAPVLDELALDIRELGGWDRTGIARARGADDIAAFWQHDLDQHGITTRADLIAWTKQKLDVRDAHSLAQVVSAMGGAVWAELISEEDAWHVILVAGKLAQQRYQSWDDFAAGYVQARAGDLSKCRALWSELPWSTELGVTLVDPTAKLRVLASRCPTCNAPRVRPSPTAYVYCDHCGALMDYDFSVALSIPIEQPGPVYEQLRGQLASDLAAARDAGDVDGYRALQCRLFAAWVRATSTGTPPRIKDPIYRDRYVAWLAEAQVVADFDAEARAREVAMHAAVGKLKFISAQGRIRVPSDAFRALVDAMFAYEARRDELYVERGVYALHPDSASRELQRRIGMSAFTQAWLPMLEPAEADALLARTALVREYALVEPPALRATPCTHCGGPLAIVDGAKRVLCDHCGRLVDVVG